MSITNKNLIVITTTMPDEIISSKRRNNLINELSKYRINILFTHGIRKNGLIPDMYVILYEKFVEFAKLNYEYAIICDDDFFPINHFLTELNETVDLLPSNWKGLHLCPGFLWGRKFRDKSKIGKLNPEFEIDNLKYHSSGRFFENNTSNDFFNLQGWFGGPISFLLKKSCIVEIIQKYLTFHTPERISFNDHILTKMLDENTYVCREPQLGYEEECGRSVFSIEQNTSF